MSSSEPAESPSAPPPARRSRRSGSGGDGGKASARRDLVEAEIYEQATRLFAERGFAGTSLTDIAEAMGMTRPALYHYVKNKDELLARLVTEITESPADAVAEIAVRTDLGAEDKLRTLVRLIALRQARHAARFRLVIRSESELPAELATAHETAKRRVLEGFSRVVDEGVRRGEFRPRDTRTTALALIGMCNWIAWWFRPGGAQTEDEVAETMGEMAVSLVAQPADRVPEHARPDSPAAALTLLRQDLDYLERVLEDPISSDPSKD